MDFRWKCLHVKPNIRFESEGEPVPVNFFIAYHFKFEILNLQIFKSNSKLVICHSATHKLLAGEDTLFKGIFGMVIFSIFLKLEISLILY